MKIWLICGSSSGVGKSTLANELSVLLPRTLVIKVGHGRVKRGRVPYFFTDADEAISFIESQKNLYEHIIVESNRLVGKLKTDIIIFLEGYIGERRHDASKLKAKAGIKLGLAANQRQWAEELAKANLPITFIQKVVEILTAQNEYLIKNRITLRTKIWFSKSGLIVFGEGLAKILCAIESEGSLSKAAKSVGVSYRHAWGDIKRAEERLGFHLLECQIGGQRGGGAKLTPKAKKLLEGYEQLKRKIIKQSDKWFDSLLKELEEE